MSGHDPSPGVAPLGRVSILGLGLMGGSLAMALRRGGLYDLLGRVRHGDMREAPVAQFMRRYHVDATQAERVRALAQELSARG